MASKYDYQFDPMARDVGESADATFKPTSLQDEIDGHGWTKLTKPWGGTPDPAPTSGGQTGRPSSTP